MKSEAMANEVESILNEIRERVRTAHQQGNASVANSDQTAEVALAHAHAEDGSGDSAALSRLSAHLTTTSRAWDRLPPMYSNRKGGAARVELWIKARLKSMSRWFTWEQVNFNSAVHHALSETLNALAETSHALYETSHALAAYQQELAGLRAELGKENESRRAGIEALTADTKGELDAARVEVTSRLGELAFELREADQQLREEQRVCFKQLSLETSEAAVIEDRGRRTIESRLNKLEKALPNGETGQ